MPAAARLVLASRSPRRQELLRQLGVDFEVLPADVPELRAANESPRQYVERVALDKARAVHRQLASTDGVLILGADTEVVLDDEVFGKPVDKHAAAAMLARLAGRSHAVISAVWLVGAVGEAGATSISRVSIAALDAASIAAYVATGEPRGKAGGYAIQGRAAAFVAHLEGSYSGVMGLPLHETAGLLMAGGVL